MFKKSSRQIVILVSAAVAGSYLVYRLLFTLNLTTPYAVFASVFLYSAEVFGVIGMLLFFLQVWDTSEPPQKPVLEGRTVDVFVPTYNETPDLLRTTLRAGVNMDYPHRTYLCDDGGTEARLNDPEKGPATRKRVEELKALCAEVGATYVTRPENAHAKAGNLNHAFQHTEGEFIIILDADHVPDRHFITRLIGYFEDEQLAFVQTPHAFYNFDSFQARVNYAGADYWEEGQLFYHVIQPGRNRWNAAIFAGSAAMFRRKALEDVGYLACETITEDIHTGLRMHSRGWKSLAISERMISGQAAQDVTTFHSQRLRWGEGNLSVLAYDNPLTTPGLSLGQRLCYLGTVLYWCGGLFYLAIYLTPLLMLCTGVPPVREFTWTLGIITLLYLVACIVGIKIAGNGYYAFCYSELFAMSSFWTKVRADVPGHVSPPRPEVCRHPEARPASHEHLAGYPPAGFVHLRQRTGAVLAVGLALVRAVRRPLQTDDRLGLGDVPPVARLPGGPPRPCPQRGSRRHATHRPPARRLRDPFARRPNPERHGHLRRSERTRRRPGHL